MELRVGAMELQEENLKLRERVKQLESELTLARDTVFEPDTGLYWLRKPEGSRDGPFCAVCHDKDKKLVRLHDGRNREAKTPWVCIVCDNTFGDYVG